MSCSRRFLSMTALLASLELSRGVSEGGDEINVLASEREDINYLRAVAPHTPSVEQKRLKRLAKKVSKK